MDPAHKPAESEVLERSIMRRAEVQPGKRKVARFPVLGAEKLRIELKRSGQLREENANAEAKANEDEEEEQDLALRPPKRRRLNANQRLALAYISPQKAGSCSQRQA